jgi:hypothetical protein
MIYRWMELGNSSSDTIKQSQLAVTLFDAFENNVCHKIYGFHNS